MLAGMRALSLQSQASVQMGSSLPHVPVKRMRSIEERGPTAFRVGTQGWVDTRLASALKQKGVWRAWSGHRQGSGIFMVLS